MKFHFVYHVPFEESGRIGSWAQAQDHSVSVTRLWNKESLPQPKDVDFAVIMGGPMNIYEENIYPWLTAEKKWIEQVIGLQKKVLGVCLGAQLIADVLGGKVFKNKEKEIGWLPIEWTAEGRQFFDLTETQSTVFHWHGDTFPLPPAAVRLAKSKACENQAFSYKENIVGLQFHLESTPDTVQLLIENCGNELVQGNYIQTEDEITAAKAPYGMIHRLLESVLKKMTAEDSLPSAVPRS